MRRTILVGISLGLMFVPSASAREGQQGGGRGQDRHAELRRDVDAMTARLAGQRPTSQQAIADAQRLTSGYRSLVPFVRGFRPADYVLNIELARRSLEWLARATPLFGRDPLAASAFLRSYDAIGGFYGDSAPFYRPGAFVAFAGATRLARRLILDGRDPNRFERELERYALAYGTLAAYSGAFQTPWTTAYDLPQSAPPPPGPERTVELKPVELPDIDASGLDAEQQGAWTDARERFRTVAPRVHAARVLLNELSERLQHESIALHPVDAANALKMQGYLEDAVDLIREGRFHTAIEALTRADYMRAKLKSVTGQ
jgi:hypothetical protein